MMASSSHLFCPGGCRRGFYHPAPVRQTSAPNVNRQHHAANHGRELEQTFLSQFFVRQRRVRGTKINGISDNLFYATGRTDTAVVNFITGFSGKCQPIWHTPAQGRLHLHLSGLLLQTQRKRIDKVAATTTVATVVRITFLMSPREDS